MIKRYANTLSLLSLAIISNACAVESDATTSNKQQTIEAKLPVKGDIDCAINVAGQRGRFDTTFKGGALNFAFSLPQPGSRASAEGTRFPDIQCEAPGRNGSYTCKYRGGKANIRASVLDNFHYRNEVICNDPDSCETILVPAGNPTSIVDGHIVGIDIHYAPNLTYSDARLYVDTNQGNNSVVGLHLSRCESRNLEYESFTVTNLNPEAPAGEQDTLGKPQPTQPPSTTPEQTLVDAMSKASTAVKAVAYCHAQCGLAGQNIHARSFDYGLCVNTRNAIQNTCNQYKTSADLCGVNCDISDAGINDDKLGQFARQMCRCNKLFNECSNHNTTSAQCPPQF